ncbi:hypothetical protein SAY86_026940 [Trapa natans]|uniref:Protein kinase domain-containing protein n=1 Tax=Trapa natans TaxID=22666 RepID=A0AAN7KS73_TRANT|nr:hypothetical protein SAY86_026940 [Trapa natans]
MVRFVLLHLYALTRGRGITRGLAHLHHVENLIHGNLTSTNILVRGWRSQDLRLRPLPPHNARRGAGLPGARAVEAEEGQHEDPDVYSLGVIFLELLTGKSPGEKMNGGGDLPQWVASILKEEWINEVFDVELMKEAPAIGDELLNTLKLALHCLDPSPSVRPEAEQILQQLEEIRPDENSEV